MMTILAKGPAVRGMHIDSAWTMMNQHEHDHNDIPPLHMPFTIIPAEKEENVHLVLTWTIISVAPIPA